MFSKGVLIFLAVLCSLVFAYMVGRMFAAGIMRSVREGLKGPQPSKDPASKGSSVITGNNGGYSDAQK